MKLTATSTAAAPATSAIDDHWQPQIQATAGNITIAARANCRNWRRVGFQFKFACNDMRFFSIELKLSEM